MVFDRVTVGLFILAVILLTAVGTVYLLTPQYGKPKTQPGTLPQDAVNVTATGLDVPWAIAFLPNGDMLVTERPGTLIRIENRTHHRSKVAGVQPVGEGGLLGVAVDPRFKRNQFIYLYITTGSAPDNLTNKVVRYTLHGNQLSDEHTIIDGIPAGRYHDGGRIAFGPDNKLYITTGDSEHPRLAQDRNSLAGKILRLNPDGSVPGNNPFNSPVYSYGHRNPEGIAWDEQGRLWETEHGDRAMDELNLIQPGGNYGWPIIQGYENRTGMMPPVYLSGPRTTWAPAGVVYVNRSIVFAGLRGESLYVAQVNGTQVTAFHRYMRGTYGRLRAVTLGPDGNIYVSTSNRDGRGSPRTGDDKILRIDPDKLIS